MDRNRELVPDNEPGKRKSADQMTVQKDGILNTRVSVEERSYQEGV